MKTPRVALYLRVSTTEQSTDSQQLELAAYCARQGWSPATYADTASGAKGATRPQLDQLMQDVRSGKIDVVVITKLDRLGRSLPHFALLVDELRTHGVGLIAISQGIDTRASNPMGALMLGILGAVSEFELSLIRERTKAGLAAARARGTHCGRPSLPSEQRGRILEAASRLGRRVRPIARELGMAPSTVGRVLRSETIAT